MGRETRTAAQLRAMVQVRLNALPEVAELMCPNLTSRRVVAEMERGARWLPFSRSVRPKT